MKTYGTYFQNDKEKPIIYGEINLINPKRQRLRGEPLLGGIEAVPVFQGFCGTDFELMKMGRENKLCTKFPEGETYFEYGCDGADGLFCDKNYFNPDMLLKLPEKYEGMKKLPLSVAKKLSFADPYACAIFQLERMEDLGEAQNFRVEMAKHKCTEAEARALAKDNIFERTVVFGLGMTGLFIADQIRMNHPNAKILFIGRSDKTSRKVVFSKEIAGADYLCTAGLSEEETAQQIIEMLGGRATMFIGTSGTNIEHRVAFEQKVLGCNGIYNSFSLGPKVQYDTMLFGFENHLIFASINFRQEHMEKAIDVLVDSRYDDVVELIDKDEFIADPLDAYENKIFCKGAPLKTGVIWNKEYIEEDK